MDRTLKAGENDSTVSDHACNSDELEFPRSSGDEIVPLNEETRLAIPADVNRDVALASSSITLNEGTFHGANFGPQTNTQQVIANNYENATISHHHHYYPANPSNSEPESELKKLNREQPGDSCHPEKDNVKISEDVSMCNKTPLRQGSKIYPGYQQHASGDKLKVAIKIIVPCIDKNVKEVQHLVKLACHPNVVQIIQSKVIEANMRELYIVMELCSSQNLQDYLKKKSKENSSLDFDKTMSYSKQLVAGMKHIHKHQIVHRDMKPENVLLSLNHEFIKLSDFGISKELKHGKSVTKQTTQGQGTDGYRAPETYNSDEISKSSDIYSLGLTLYSLWSNGRHAFGDDDDLLNYNIKKNLNRDLSGLLLAGVKKDQLKDLISWMLEFDPEKRPTIEQVLNHVFFAETSISSKDVTPMKGGDRQDPEPVVEDVVLIQAEYEQTDACRQQPEDAFSEEGKQAGSKSPEILFVRSQENERSSDLSQNDSEEICGTAKLQQARSGRRRRKKNNTSVSDKSLSYGNGLKQAEQVCTVATLVKEKKTDDNEHDSKLERSVPPIKVDNHLAQSTTEGQDDTSHEDLTGTQHEYSMESGLPDSSENVDEPKMTDTASTKSPVASRQDSTTSWEEEEGRQAASSQVDNRPVSKDVKILLTESQHKPTCSSSGARPKRAGSSKKRRSRKKSTNANNQASNDEATCRSLRKHLPSNEDGNSDDQKSVDGQNESIHHKAPTQFEAVRINARQSLLQTEVAIATSVNSGSQIPPVKKSSGKPIKRGSKKNRNPEELSSQEDSEATDRRQKAIASFSDLFLSDGSQFRDKLFKLRKKIPGFFSCKVVVMCQGCYLFDGTVENLQNGHRLVYPDKAEESNSLREIHLNSKTMLACEVEVTSVIESAEVLEELKPDLILWFDKKSLDLFVMTLCDTKTLLYNEFETHPKQRRIPPGKEFLAFSTKNYLDWIQRVIGETESQPGGIKLYVGDWKDVCLEIVLVPKIMQFLLGKK